MAVKTQADARKSGEGIRYHLTSHRRGLPMSPLQNPAPCLGPKQGHPHHQQPALYLPIAIKHAAAANTGISAKSPCKQFWSEPLGACNIPFGPSWVFSVLLVGWQAPTLCASALSWSLADGATCPHSSRHHKAVGMGSTRETHIAGPGHASVADANQPAMCTQPRPGKTPPPQ